MSNTSMTTPYDPEKSFALLTQDCLSLVKLWTERFNKATEDELKMTSDSLRLETKYVKDVLLDMMKTELNKARESALLIDFNIGNTDRAYKIQRVKLATGMINYHNRRVLKDTEKKAKLLIGLENRSSLNKCFASDYAQSFFMVNEDRIIWRNNAVPSAQTLPGDMMKHCTKQIAFLRYLFDLGLNLNDSQTISTDVNLPSIYIRGQQGWISDKSPPKTCDESPQNEFPAWLHRHISDSNDDWPILSTLKTELEDNSKLYSLDDIDKCKCIIYCWVVETIHNPQIQADRSPLCPVQIYVGYAENGVKDRWKVHCTNAETTLKKRNECKGQSFQDFEKACALSTPNIQLVEIYLALMRSSVNSALFMLSHFKTKSKMKTEEKTIIERLALKTMVHGLNIRSGSSGGVEDDIEEVE